MALSIGWTNHLLSTRSAIQSTVAKMERIAVAGLSPSGSAGQPLTPIPTDEWDTLRRGLQSLLDEMDTLVAALAPQEAARSVERRPIEATRTHLTLLLREMDQNILADLTPQRGARYGKIASDDETVLTAHLARMHKHIETLQGG